jgi:hypothetical protein
VTINGIKVATALFHPSNMDAVLDRKFLKQGPVAKYPEQPDLVDMGKSALEGSSWATSAIDDERLREWVDESRVVRPMLDAMVKNGHHGGDRLRPALEDLGRRVEALEREVARWRAARSDA